MNKLINNYRYGVFIKYCVFIKRFQNIPDSVLSLFSLGVGVHTSGRQNTSAAAELAEFRKITKFYGKTQYLMNTLYLRGNAYTSEEVSCVHRMQVDQDILIRFYTRQANLDFSRPNLVTYLRMQVAYLVINWSKHPGRSGNYKY